MEEDRKRQKLIEHKNLIKKEILRRLKFFEHFYYFPLEDELYKFLRLKVSKKDYLKTLKELIDEGKIKYFEAYGKRVSLSQNNLKTLKRNFLDRVGWYKKKFLNKKFQIYLKILKLFPQIKFVGLSGSLAWGTAKEKDDIDLFIITKKNRLWTGRFLAIILALILGIKRKRTEKQAPGKVCLNLFFDEDDLKIPKIKQNEYVAFELLALKPIFDKGVYSNLLQENKELILRYFPNFKLKKVKIGLRYKKGFGVFKFLIFFSDLLEFILGSLQLFLINRHKTREFITSTQLWFFPEDFERKYKKLI